MNTIVLKFGGTSVANNEKLDIVSNKIITLYDEGYDVVVVVSAQGKRTDQLLNEAYEIDPNPKARELDVLLSVGEQESIAKLGILLNKKGYKAISLLGWQAGIYTNNVNQNALIDHIDETRIIDELSKGKIVIVAGFQGVNHVPDVTTLGRGGSDTTAVSIAAKLGAKCYIYSDVEGIFTTDPRKMENPQKLKNISYDEMLDVSNEGAKVLHNRCVEVAKKYNIPIVAKSTFSNDEGTVINDVIEEQRVKSIVKNDELTVLHLRKLQYNYFDLYEVFIKNEIIPVEFLDEHNKYTVTIKSNDYERAKYVLRKENSDFIIKINKITRISIIGSGIVNDTVILKKTIQCLEQTDSKNKIRKIEINNGKIRATFTEVISNHILQKLHMNLIE